MPTGVTSINISANGAQGGSSDYGSGGAGAMMSGTFTVIPGHVLNILTGQQGFSGGYTGGGGGGSYVWDVTAGNTLLVAAGAGGGAGLGSSYNGVNAVTTMNGTDDGFAQAVELAYPGMAPPHLLVAQPGFMQLEEPVGFQMGLTAM